MEKKAARERLAIEALQQSSSLATAAAALIKEGAFKGIVGIAFAAAGIASLFALFKRFKAETSNIDVPQFKDGTEYVEGEGTHKSDSVFARLSKGERVVPWEQNKELLEAGITNKQLPAYALLGKQLAENRMQYPFIPAAAQLTANEQELRQAEQKRDEINFGNAVDKAANKIISEMRRKPKVIPLNPNGRTKVMIEKYNDKGDVVGREKRTID